jgi:GNAT superfamily N-acetyltransferase
VHHVGMDGNSFSPGMTGLAEATEAELYFACETGAPAATKKELGIATARIGGGVALSMREDRTSFWSKALGLGVTEPVTARLVDEVLSFFRAEGTPSALLQIAPSLLPADWESIAAERGLRGESAWMKLAAPIDQLTATGTTQLRVAKVRPDEAERWASAVLRGFGMPEATLGPMFAAYVEDPAFTLFAVWDGDEIVAGANLFIHGAVASLNHGSTLPGHYRRGAQSALIAARIEAAREAGCSWVTSESGKPRPGEANPSLDNLQRAGLRPMYARQNWRWTNPDVQ